MKRVAGFVVVALLVAACGAPSEASSAAPVGVATPVPETRPMAAATSNATMLPIDDASPQEAAPTAAPTPTTDGLSLESTHMDSPASSAAASASLDGTVPRVSASDPYAALEPTAGTGTSDSTAAGDPGLGADPTCDGSVRADPLPAPGSPRSQDFFRSFRTPLPPAPLFDPPGPKRVGLQAGHWLTDQVPPELGRLQGGSSGGGKQEWEVNLDVAQRTAARLEAAGIAVDVLPSTVPPHYQANVFIALHADGDPAGAAHGFKVARPGFSSVPEIDDKLVDTLNTAYGAVTELPRDDDHISLRMRYYYAFNSRRYCHAVAPGVPQAIIEMAYLTSATDRQYLIGDPERLAQGVAAGIQAFLATLP